MLNKPLRILIVDDNADIHRDFFKVLATAQVEEHAALSSMRKKLFSSTNENENEFITSSWILDSAWGGEAALEKVKQSIIDKEPYALAFVDIRMPPGWDGIETIAHLWEADPDIEIVICSAHSDYSWETISQKLVTTENYLILKKPFDVIEIRQFATALTKKWLLKHQVREQIKELTALTDNLEKSLSVTKATFESVMEGILVIDQNGNTVMHNELFTNIWDVPKDLLTADKSRELISYLASKVDDPEFFKDLLIKPTKLHNENIREWPISSGKILEIYTQPYLLHGVTIGNVCSFRDITIRKKLEEDLLHQATHDSLTGLPNRILLKDRIIQAISQAKRFNQYVGVLLLDLDNFKQINDSLGHDAGDNLLQSVTTILKRQIREGDTLTRLGGDEFVIVLSAQSRKDVLGQRAQEFIDAVSKPFKLGDHDCIVTASIGISINPEDGQDPDTLLKNADSALYRAKEMGKNNFVFYKAEFNENMLLRVELTTALRQALDKNQLSIDYQPLVNSKTRQIVGAEALLRWNHPQNGSIPTQDFVPLAEETGVILTIGEWVLKTACLQNKKWYDKGYRLRVAVNISTVQFMQRNFVQLVADILAATKLPAELLELEITETIILKNVSDVIEKMTALKNIGVHITIDDFGTGYSGLSYLKYFPFDKVKIDKSFVDGIQKNKNERSLIEALITMTRQFGVVILAEGIENDEQANFISEHHGDEMQGHLFSPPLENDQLTKLLEKTNTPNQKKIPTS